MKRHNPNPNHLSSAGSSSRFSGGFNGFSAGASGSGFSGAVTVNGFSNSGASSSGFSGSPSSNGFSTGASGSGYASSSAAAVGKAKLWEDDQPLQDNTMDELLAVLGYKVRSSDMNDVAQKLEQLEEAMVNTQTQELSQFGSESVHYNPSDLSTWLESMLTELNAPSCIGPFTAPGTAPCVNSTITTSSVNFGQNPLGFEESSSSDYDLTAITGRAVLESSSSNKRMKVSEESNNANSTNSDLLAESTRTLVLVDSQENGIRLVHMLMACAEAVQQNNLNLAEALLKQVGFLAATQVGAMRKVATYFAEALARRIYNLSPHNPIDHSMAEVLHNNFYETCPYLKFAHFTANQAILEAFDGKSRVHVIDFGINQGLQWPALMQALALRPGGPPAFRLTGIGPPAQDGQDHLQEVGWKLAQLAETIHVKFEYRGFVANSLADLNASMLNLRPSDIEPVAVNSVFELHKLLARPGAIEKVLDVVKDCKPEIVTIVEQEANHNGSVFLDRFTESLHYYSTMFDSLEGSMLSQDKALSEVYLGRQICNVVACDGLDRVERHEPLVQWRERFGSAGFEPVHLGSNAYKQASMLLALFTGGEGYRVEENNGCLMLGWHTRPLIATSAWRVGVQ